MDKKFLEQAKRQISEIQNAQVIFKRTIEKEILKEARALLGTQYENDDDVQEFLTDEANTAAWAIAEQTETIDYIFSDFETRMPQTIRRFANKAAQRTIGVFG